MNAAQGIHLLQGISLLQTSPPTALVLLIFFLNAALSVLLAYILTYTIHIDIVKRKTELLVLLAITGMFIPFLGNIFNLIGICLLSLFTKNFSPLSIHVQPIYSFARKKPVRAVAYGMNWANVRFQSSRFSKDEQLEALRGLSRGQVRDVNLIYKKLVSDDEEELRVRAFSMLENQHNYLHRQINSLTNIFNSSPESISSTSRGLSVGSMSLRASLDPTDKPRDVGREREEAVSNVFNKTKALQHRAFIAKQLALLYWELVYRNLADEEFRAIVLERSLHYALIALQSRPEDARLWLLTSRIHILQNNLEESLHDLNQAAILHAPPSRYLPFFAEIAYKNRDYPAVIEYFKANPSLQYLLKINSIYKLWCHT